MLFLGAVTMLGGALLERQYEGRFDIADNKVAHMGFSCGGKFLRRYQR